PGYSAISQAGSDLGVGPNAWMLNASFFITGLLLIAFALGFFVEMRQMLGKRRRVACLVLLILAGIGFITLGIFTEAPATVTLHWTLGLPLATLPPVVVYALAGWQWQRVPGWRGYGWYSLLTVVGTVGSYFLTFAFFNPASSWSTLHIGGLMERLFILVIFAWDIVIGWRVFLQAGARQQANGKQHT
ncbi:MAG TPA: DUF998 domain-containing protein, partial [Ktedonobacterales bacterium]|nr:DUF998 domain-containing protein [Ktedonobacterales bacterium]